MVVTHSRRRVLISVRSQAPASVGVGRGMILGKDSEISDFEVDVEGRISAWKIMNYRSVLTLNANHSISKYIRLYWITFIMLTGSCGFTKGGGSFAGLFVARFLFVGEGPFLTGLLAFFLL